MPKKSRKSTFSAKTPAAKRKAEWRQSQDPDELLTYEAKRKKESRNNETSEATGSRLLTAKLNIAAARRRQSLTISRATRAAATAARAQLIKQLSPDQGDSNSPAEILRLSKVRCALDHNYAYPYDMDALRRICDEQGRKMESLITKNKALRIKLKRKEVKIAKITARLRDIEVENVNHINSHHCVETNEGPESNLMMDLISPKSKTSKYSEPVLDFARTLHAHSPKGYEFVRETFHLPCSSLLRRLASASRDKPDSQEKDT